MKKAYSILVLLFCSQLFFSQKEKIAVYAGVELQPTLYKYQPAAHINVRSYLNDRISLGGALGFTSKKYNENFGYSADRTRSNHLFLNILTQNDFVNTDKFVFSMYLSTGLYFFSLVNPDDKTTETVYNDIDGILVESKYEVPRKLSRDVFFNFQGGLDLSVKLATIKEDEIGIYLTSRAGYQHVFGNGDFLNGNQFSKPIFSVGVTIKGNK